MRQGDLKLFLHGLFITKRHREVVVEIAIFRLDVRLNANIRDKKTIAGFMGGFGGVLFAALLTV